MRYRSRFSELTKRSFRLLSANHKLTIRLQDLVSLLEPLAIKIAFFTSAPKAHAYQHAVVRLPVAKASGACGSRSYYKHHN